MEQMEIRLSFSKGSYPVLKVKERPFHEFVNVFKEPRFKPERFYAERNSYHAEITAVTELYIVRTIRKEHFCIRKDWLAPEDQRTRLTSLRNAYRRNSVIGSRRTMSLTPKHKNPALSFHMQESGWAHVLMNSRCTDAEWKRSQPERDVRKKQVELDHKQNESGQ